MKALYCSICGCRTTDTGHGFECNECGAEMTYNGEVVVDYDGEISEEDEENKEENEKIFDEPVVLQNDSLIGSNKVCQS